MSPRIIDLLTPLPPERAGEATDTILRDYNRLVHASFLIEMKYLQVRLENSTHATCVTLGTMGRGD